MISRQIKGDLSMRLEVTGGDEIGSVGRNVKCLYQYIAGYHDKHYR